MKKLIIENGLLPTNLAESIGIVPEKNDTIYRVSGVGGSEFVYSKKIDSVRVNMRVVLILIISFLTLVGCESNTNDEMNNNVELGALTVEGCIQVIGKTMFLMDHDGVMMKISVNKIDMNELIEGKSYKLELSQILESNPPIIVVESYKEINKNYCD